MSEDPGAVQSKFMEGALIELRQAMILLLHTGQRRGDVIRMRLSDHDGEFIRPKQPKTDAPVEIPCTAALRRMLDSMPRPGPYILTRANGLPWFTEWATCKGLDNAHEGGGDVA